jgi:hypothetical protein
MEDYYFTYYVFGFNMAAALFVGTVIVQLPMFQYHLQWWLLAIIGLAFVTFAADSFFLRRDIVKHTKQLPDVNETS